MQQNTAILVGASLGARVMYLLDPARGTRRRAMVCDQVVHLMHSTSEMAEVTSRDLKHRVRGAVADLRSQFTHDQPTDAVLVARVRAKLGHLTRHPGALEVSAHHGSVSIRGALQATEVKRVRAKIRSVRGVKGVEEHLEIYHRAEERPDREGGVPTGEALHEVSATRWSPTKRLLATTSGGALITVGISARGVLGTAAGIAGARLVVRGLTNKSPRRLVGLDRAHLALALQKTLTIHAPVGQVFAFWSQYEQFPRFLPHVREVKRISAEESRWVVTGPWGFPVWWDAVVTRLVPNGFLAWKTLPGPQVSHLGSVRFEAGNKSSTRIDMMLAYTPPAGIFGHLLATLLGANPKHLLDTDLVCFKSLLEDGKISIHGHEVTREDLAGQWREREA